MPESSFETLAEDIKEMLATVTRTDVSMITPDTNLALELNLDSLAATQLLVIIEKRYNIEIDELRALEIVTFRDAVDLVLSCL